ncbi:hypothetical protein R6Q57_021808 [Mikania cordata]
MLCDIDDDKDFVIFVDYKYKLVICVTDKGEDLSCMLFDEATFALIGITADDLLMRSFTEVIFHLWSYTALMIHIGLMTFFDTLLARRVTIKIKIDRYNLAPNYVRCFTVSKYIGDDINLLNKDKTMSTAGASQVLPSNDVVSDGDVDDTIDNYPNITDDEWTLADESMWIPPITPKYKLRVANDHHDVHPMVNLGILMLTCLLLHHHLLIQGSMVSTQQATGMYVLTDLSLRDKSLHRLLQSSTTLQYCATATMIFAETSGYIAMVLRYCGTAAMILAETSGYVASHFISGGNRSSGYDRIGSDKVMDLGLNCLQYGSVCLLVLVVEYLSVLFMHVVCLDNGSKSNLLVVIFFVYVEVFPIYPAKEATAAPAGPHPPAGRPSPLPIEQCLFTSLVSPRSRSSIFPSFFSPIFLYCQIDGKKIKHRIRWGSMNGDKLKVFKDKVIAGKDNVQYGDTNDT